MNIAQKPASAAPVADPRPERRVIHGITVEDPYAWLRADNWREVMADPSVLAADIRGYLEAENDYSAAQMAATEGLQRALFEELKGRIKQDDSTVPSPDGPYAYWARFREGDEHPRLVRASRALADERVVLDANAEAAGSDYFRLGGAEHSDDHALLAWAADRTGGEEFEVRVRDVATGADLADRIGKTSGGAVWAADGRTLFYTRLDDNHRPASVWRHTLGTDASTDVPVYEESDPGFFVGVGRTLSDAWIVIDSHDHQTSECRLIPADRPDAAPRLVVPRIVENEYSVEHRGDALFILTRDTEAEDFKIVTAPVAAPDRHNWRDLVPHEAGRTILSMAVFADYLVRLERRDGLPRIIVRALDSGEEHAIRFDEEAYSLGLSAGYEFATTTLRFVYSSPSTPMRVYDYDMTTRERILRKEQEIPSGHDPADYVVRRIFAPAPDGEAVPISLYHHRSTAVDGTAPCMLYGYGAYGMIIPAGFNGNSLSLVNRGFVYAIAHVRGGRDKGFRWYRDGRRENKANTFSDFIASARHLIAAGFARPDGIVAHGGSAGGMLMGAVANMAPELFRGIVAEVPFVDVLNTMLDDTLPLTPPEWPEWGNPIDSAEDFARILSYSPYDNVTAQDYPAMLVLAGVSDPRVTYWEPAKWVARLRATRSNDAPLYLKTNMTAGHGGASGRFKRLEEVALIQAFALKTVGDPAALAAA